MYIKVKTADDLSVLSQLNYITAALRVSLQLNLWSVLGDDQCSLEELATRAGCEPAPLEILLKLLVYLNLFTYDGKLYASTEISKRNLQNYLNDRLIYNTKAVPVDQIYNTIVNHSHLQFDDSVFFEDEPENLDHRLRAMNISGEYLAMHLIRALKHVGSKTLLDVGCGSGIFAITLCKFFIKLRACCLDKKQVVDKLAPLIKKHELEDRIKVFACDISSDDITNGNSYDYILFSNVLHCLKIETITSLIQKCYIALNHGGTLIINEIFLNDDNLLALFLSLGFLKNGIVFLNKENMVDIIKQTGFKKIKEITIENTPSTFLLVKK